MRLKYRIKEGLQFLAFAFYPKTTLIACAVFSAIVIVILGIVMTAIPQRSNWYSIVFALTTGAAGSFFVSFVVELASNYRHNKLAWYELQEYYSVVMCYESHKQVMMRLTPHQRAESKAHEEFVAAGGVEEINEDDEPKDIIQITWKQLPDIIPVFRQTLNDKKEFLSDAEINELKNILSNFFDEIFHLSSAAIKLEYLIGFHFQSCYNKGIQVDHLSIRLFNFKYDSARMAPGSGLIQEFAVFYSVIHLIVLCCTVQSYTDIIRCYATTV